MGWGGRVYARMCVVVSGLYGVKRTLRKVTVKTSQAHPMVTRRETACGAVMCVVGQSAAGSVR